MAPVHSMHDATSLHKGHSSVYYESKSDKCNPVIKCVELDLKNYVKNVLRKHSPDYRQDDAGSRINNELFEIWNKFEHRLPLEYYLDKLMEIGDFLISLNEHAVALWQCYERFLYRYGDEKIENITTPQTLSERYFSSYKSQMERKLICRALLGRAVCKYELIHQQDPKLINNNTIHKCLVLLNHVRLISQTLLPDERLSWVVYNATIHIYNMSRPLMALGHCIKVIEYILWASMCMEHCVPLMAVKYLPWRTTLYVAVCQCYYDCKQGEKAESFARHCLSRVNELSHLESLNDAPPNPLHKTIFREAAMKLGIMIFRRIVFESRRKPKGLLRPKTRTNLKDYINMPWPRTQTERILADMFTGSAAQLLAILDSLRDTNRRTLTTSLPASEVHEPEILDVFAELFLAAQEIITGNPHASGAAKVSPMKASALSKLTDRSLLDMARSAENGATVHAAVEIIKHAFNYEFFDVFEAMVEPVLSHIRSRRNESYGGDEKCLEILLAMYLFTNNTRAKLRGEDIVHLISSGASAPVRTAIGTVMRDATTMQDDLIVLADVLNSVIKNYSSTDKSCDLDMTVDAALFLWNKTKVTLQRFQTGSSENARYLLKMDNAAKWLYLLETINNTLSWAGTLQLDPILCAEIVLRLSLAFEASAGPDQTDSYEKSVQDMSLSQLGPSTYTMPASVPPTTAQSIYTSSQFHHPETSASPHNPPPTAQHHRDQHHRDQHHRDQHHRDQHHRDQHLRDQHLRDQHQAPPFNYLNLSPRQQLLNARDIIAEGIRNISEARQMVELDRALSIADISWMKLMVHVTQLASRFMATMCHRLVSARHTPQMAQTSSLINTDRGESGLAPRTPGLINMSPSLQLDGGHASRHHNHPTEQPFIPFCNTITWNTICDLHLELIASYHRVCMKLLALQQETSNKGSKSEHKMLSTSITKIQRSNKGSAGKAVKSWTECLESCNKNLISKALLLMHKALHMTNITAVEKQELLEESLTLIQKAEKQERQLYKDNTITIDIDKNDLTPTNVPPPPILKCRTDGSMTFKPAPFTPASGQKVAWYRLFGHDANTHNKKARLSDYHLPGTGQEIPADGCVMRVSGLTHNEKYMFAVAAYTSDGSLIGDSIGDTTRPILASHPLPILMVWSYLAQISYQLKCFPIATKANEVLWKHFVAQPAESVGDTYTTSIKPDFVLTEYKLDRAIIQNTSQILLRHFVNSLLSNADIEIKQKSLFCDILSDQGPLYPGQFHRLLVCETLLVAMEIGGWLNDPNILLQTVVTCYGLLGPLVFYRIPSLPVIQILQHCFAALREIPSTLRQKRAGFVNDSLNHMTACITYNLSKILRIWGKKTLANKLNESGRKLLAIDTVDDGGSVELKESHDETPAVKKIKKREGEETPMSQRPMSVEPDSVQNSELKALEAYVLGNQRTGEPELMGNEDPSILHTYITFLPSVHAFKQVVKFKKRNQYLEYMVMLVKKGLSEGNSVPAVEWCDDTLVWLSRRNDMILGKRVSTANESPSTTQDNKKYSATMVEYTKPKASPTVKDTPHSQTAASKKDEKRKKKRKYKTLNPNPNLSAEEQKAQEDKELQAIGKLSELLPYLYHCNARFKRLRKISNQERPYRSQLNVLCALCKFNNLLRRMEDKPSPKSGRMFDHEWFTMETAGIIVGRRQTYSDIPDTMSESDESDDGGNDSSALLKSSPSQRPLVAMECAAATAIGRYNAVPCDTQSDSTRTYVTDTGAARIFSSRGSKRSQTSRITRTVAFTMMKSIMTHLTRAIVLAHRGGHWTLLQNSCIVLVDCCSTAMAYAHEYGSGTNFVSVEDLEMLLWQPFYIACICYLDMMTSLQVDLVFRAKRAHARGRVYGKYFSSWVGDHMDEKAGASLRFEDTMDDTTNVDMRLMKKLVLHTLETLLHQCKWERLVDLSLRFNAITELVPIMPCIMILLHQCKWERLVDLSLRFNAITEHRYATQVLPLLVYAQRNITQLIEITGGHPPPQPHIKNILDQLNGIITAKEYTIMQVTIVMPSEPRPAKTKDGLSVIYGKRDSLRNSVMPLDTEYNLRLLEKINSEVNYTSHSLHHSRALLVLYLAGRCAELDEKESECFHVGFLGHEELAEPDVPRVFCNSEFKYDRDIKRVALQTSQLNIVISSYKKSIEMLRAKRERGLTIQAMKELGDVYFDSGKTRSAFNLWSDTLDLILGQTDVIKNWKTLLEGDGDFSVSILAKCGIWGCINAAIIASNISKYIVAAKLSLRLDLCILSGYLFKALLRASMPHPHSDCQYALYEIGKGCEVTALIPGIDLFCDRFRCNGQQLVAALHWVIEELIRTKHYLTVLPLLTLYQYFACHVCRDTRRTVNASILKIRALTNLKMFHEAFIMITRLLSGKRLPHPCDSGFRHPETRSIDVTFDPTKLLSHPDNIRAIELIIEKRLSPDLAFLFGPHLTCSFLLCQLHFLLKLAKCLKVFPADLKMWDTLEMPVQATQSPTEQSTTKKDDNWAARASSKKPPVPCKPAVTPAILKGSLLYVVDDCSRQITDSIMQAHQQLSQTQNNEASLSAAELELLTECRLLQAEVARDRQHAPMAARIMLLALNTLQQSPLLSNSETKKNEPTSPKQDDEMPAKSMSVDNLYRLSDFESRMRVDSRLWTECRISLIKSQVMRVKAMGDVKGIEEKVLSGVGDCRHYIQEGLEEVDLTGDLLSKVDLLLLRVRLNIMDGRDVQESINTLQECLHILSEMFSLSITAKSTRVIIRMMLIDLQTANQSAGITSFSQYLDIHTDILNQLQEIGGTIIHQQPVGSAPEHSSPASPLTNIYLDHMDQLIKVKLRMGHALARQTARFCFETASCDEMSAHIYQLCRSLGVLRTALELCHVVSYRETNVEAELLLNIGKVENQLVRWRLLPVEVAVSRLVDAIRTTYDNEHDLGLIRQAYLEIALAYLYSSSQPLMSMTTPDSGSAPSPTSTSTKANRLLKSKSRAGSHDEDKEEIEEHRQSAWAAIRYAAAVAQAQRNRVLIVGDPVVASCVISEKCVAAVPEFAALDLVSHYVLGDKKLVFKSEIEEELSRMKNVDEAKVPETYSDEVRNTKQATQDLRWIHFLGYHTALERLSYISNFHMSIEKDRESTTVRNNDVINASLFSSDWSLRLTNLNDFFTNNLPTYANQCLAPFPPAIFRRIVASVEDISSLPPLPIVVTTYELSSPVAQRESLMMDVLSTFQTSRHDSIHPADRSTENEISFQWYCPSLMDTTHDNKILLLYASNKRLARPVKSVGQLWVSSVDLAELHTRLVLLVQRGELVLVDKVAKIRAAIPTSLGMSPTPLPNTQKSKKSSQKRIKALSPKAERDDQLESLCRQCIEDCGALLGVTSGQSPGDSAEIPFVLNKTNLSNLEQAFNPAYGTALKATDLTSWLLRHFKKIFVDLF